jgi:RNA polymerase sigma-70 factor (ECF subfamily)
MSAAVEDRLLAPQTQPGGRGLTAEQVFTEHARRIYGLVRGLVGNAADAEDVTQQVFLRVVRGLGSFREESALSTWLNRVAVNEALDFRRRRASRRGADGPRPDDREDRPAEPRWPGPTPLAALLAQERHDLIERAIARLPPPYRDVVVLAERQELSNDEIARLLGLSVAAVKSRLHRARLMLRRALAPYFDEPRVA